MTDNKETAVLFILLRSGLWEKEPEDLSLFPLSGGSWRKVFDMARQQTVTGTVYEGLCRLPDRLLPPEGLLMQWTVAADIIEQRNRRTDAVLDELCGLFRNGGLHPVLLKGQGVAQFYGKPLLRECGDIDLYFPDKREQKMAVRLIESYGISLKKEFNGSIYYIWKGIEVEHHPYLFDLYNPLLQKNLNILETSYGYTELLLSCESKSFITVPSPTLNMLLLSTHIMKHAFGWGIGLRQLCDMARACHCLQPKVASERIRDISRKAGITSWNRLLHSFLVEYLQLPVASLPYWDGMLPSRPLLDRILEGGNFGWYKAGRSKASQSWMQRKSHTLHVLFDNACFSCNYAPKEAFWMFWELLKKQLK